MLPVYLQTHTQTHTLVFSNTLYEAPHTFQYAAANSEKHVRRPGHPGGAERGTEEDAVPEDERRASAPLERERGEGGEGRKDGETQAEER